jgi:hypothetical protein
MAAIVAMYSTRLTWARPRQMSGVPRKVPLSRLKRRLTGKGGNLFAGQCSQFRQMSKQSHRQHRSDPRHRPKQLVALAPVDVARIKSESSSSKRFSSQRMCSSMLRRITCGALERGFFSAVSSATNWLRRITNAVSAGGNPECGRFNGRRLTRSGERRSFGVLWSAVGFRAGCWPSINEDFTCVSSAARLRRRAEDPRPARRGLG